MRVSRARVVLIVLCLVALPIVLADGATCAPPTCIEKHLARRVASPLDAVPDDATFVVAVDPDSVVTVLAKGDAPSTLFVMHVTPEGGADQGSAAPSGTQQALLSGGTRWTVDVDPFAGANYDITVTFRGHVVDVDGAPTSFGLTDSYADACAFGDPSGPCLP